MTRWVTGTRPDQDGRFKVQNLPAGSYLAVAVDYIPQGEWGDPELLDRLKGKAKRFTLGDGATADAGPQARRATYLMRGDGG